MTKQQKVNALHKIAKGQGVNLSAAEKSELRRYKMNAGGAYATKKNITDYVAYIDRGGNRDFYNYCMDNAKMDKRVKGSSRKEMKSQDRAMGLGAVFVGWLVWAIALYWMAGGSVQVNGCAVMGAIVAAIAYFVRRDLFGLTGFVLPIVLAVLFGVVF